MRCDQARTNRVYADKPAPGKTTKGIRKLRAAEANAGKQIVIDQAKGLEEELEAVDKSTVPEVSGIFLGFID